MGEIRLYISKSGGLYDASPVMTDVVWSGRKGSPARRIDAGLYCPDGDPASVGAGHGALLFDGEKELFRGMIIRTERTRGLFRFTAYDSGIYLTGSRDGFSYTNRTAGYIFRDIVKRLGLPLGGAADTGHVIPSLVSSGVTPWDVICGALSDTYAAGGGRYRVSSEGGRLYLRERKNGAGRWVLGDGDNVSAFRQTADISGTKTRIRVLSRAGEIIAEAADAALESKIGIFADTVRPQRVITASEAGRLAASELKRAARVKKSIEITAAGQTELISGAAAYIDIGSLGISREFFIDSDEHVFRGGTHKMKLLLTYDDEYEFA